MRSLRSILNLGILAVCLLAVRSSPSYTTYVPMVMYTEGHPMQGIGQHHTYVDCERLYVLGARWAYDWSTTPPDCEGIEGVPMLWGAGSAGQAVTGNHLLWFNEPDVASQSNLTPQEAAVLWNQYRPQYDAQRNGSPAVYSLWWLEEWLSLVTVKPDFLVVHPYQFGGTFEQAQAGFSSYLDTVDTLSYPYWLTEYAWVTDSPRQAEWLTWSLGEIAKHPLIERASWFIDWCTGEEPWAFPTTTNLCNEDGSLTSLGLAWTHAADVNNDGVVDILDISYVCAHYGEHY